MENIKYTWEESEDIELWLHDEFDSIEDCIVDAKENYDIEMGDTIAVGIVELWEPCIDAYIILERLAENADEECGEAAEAWYPYDASEEELCELSERLTRCVKEWLKERHDMPSFYKITNVKTVEVI